MNSNLSTSEENFNERRLAPRFQPQKTMNIDLNSVGADEIYQQFTCIDLSETGLKLSCPVSRKLPFRDNSLIEVRLPVPTEEDERITFLARLQRQQEHDDHRLLALRIVQIGVRDKEILRHMIHSRTGFIRH